MWYVYIYDKKCIFVKPLARPAKRWIGVKLVTLLSNSKVISKLKDSSIGGLLDWNSNYCELWSKQDGSRSGNERDLMCVNWGTYMILRRSILRINRRILWVWGFFYRKMRVLLWYLFQISLREILAYWNSYWNVDIIQMRSTSLKREILIYIFNCILLLIFILNCPFPSYFGCTI